VEVDIAEGMTICGMIIDYHY